MWRFILEAAYQDAPDKQPIVLSSTLNVRYDEYDPGCDVPAGSVTEYAHFFICGDGSKVVIIAGLSKWKYINRQTKALGYFYRPYTLVSRDAWPEEEVRVPDLSEDDVETGVIIVIQR